MDQKGEELKKRNRAARGTSGHFPTGPGQIHAAWVPFEPSAPRLVGGAKKAFGRGTGVDPGWENQGSRLPSFQQSWKWGLINIAGTKMTMGNFSHFMARVIFLGGVPNGHPTEKTVRSTPQVDRMVLEDYPLDQAGIGESPFWWLKAFFSQKQPL